MGDNIKIQNMLYKQINLNYVEFYQTFKSYPVIGSGRVILYCKNIEQVLADFVVSMFSLKSDNPS